MFNGLYEHTIDVKGRVSLPVKFREVLQQNGGESVILTTGLDGCLVAYSLLEWKKFEERIAALPQFDRGVQRLKRTYVAGAMECPIDRLGRILVPQALRQHADLKHDVVWAGAIQTGELWSLERWKQEQDHIQHNLPSIREELSRLGV